MTPERWAKVKEIFHLALEQPTGQRESVVAERCGEDDDLRLQVCSLLESHEEAERDTRLEAPLHSPADRPLDRIGPYVLEERIGSGGMGEVYRALDTRLQRVVALKILLPEFQGNAEFVQRFRREARAVSALDHPNICRLYDIGEHQGRPYLTMELIQGKTLRQRMQEGPIPVDEILEIGAQVASALTEAHSRGFLHRDIKPGNIFLTASGQVKVVDFGLAKCFTGSSDLSVSLTNSRSIPGTPSYMSPEQALAETLDVRSDIFSLGAVLYEMATRMMPFTGASPAHVLDQVLNATPPLPSVLNPNISRELDRILMRALAKRREDRFGSAAEVQEELNRLLQPASEQPRAETRSEPRRSGRKWKWALGVAAAAIAVAVVAVPRVGRAPAKHGPPRQVPFDVTPGPKDMPALSPSGDRIVYAAPSGSGSAFDIYVKLLGAGTPLPITRTDAHEMNPVFSQDGQYIAFQRMRDRNSGYFVIPALGGGERRILPAHCDLQHMGGRNIDWSPDGKHVVIADAVKAGGPRSIFRVTFASAEVKQLVSDVAYLNHPTYSPDGKWLAYVAGPNSIAQDLYMMPADGGTAIRLTKDQRTFAGLAWTPDSREIIFSSNRSGLFGLWQLALSGREPQAVAGVGPDSVSPSMARNGSQLAYLNRRIQVNLWKTALDGSGKPEQLTTSARSSAHGEFSPDGQRLVFASDRSGMWQIWRSRSDGTEPVRLTSMNAGQTSWPRWSPDGKWIAFDSNPEGHADIFVIAAEGGAVRRLTKAAGDDAMPQWSADGKSIYFTSERSGAYQVWQIQLESGEERQLTEVGAKMPLMLPDGHELYYIARGGLWRMPVPEGPEEKVIDELHWFDVALHARGIFFVTPTTSQMHSVELLGNDGKRSVVLKELGPRQSRMGSIRVSPDGKWLLFDRIDRNDNEILVIENFR